MCPLIDVGRYQMPVFPLILMLAIFSCLLVYICCPKFDYIGNDAVIKCLPLGMGFAIIGGKTTYTLVLFAQNGWVNWRELFFGGFAYYGGMLGGFCGIALACRRSKSNLLDCLDVIACLLPLGQTIGRFGCYLNGCCYGCEYDGPLAVSYPVDSEWVTVFPIWFIEATVCFILFFALLVCQMNWRGIHTALYLVVYSVVRYFIEFYRGDSIRGLWGGMSTSQILSVFVFVVGVLIAVYAIKNKYQNHLIKKNKKE